MDRITSALFKEFVVENGLEKLAEDRAFEHFAGYLATGKHFTESFDSDDISVGSGGDSGIDTIAVVVNGYLVTEPEEIDDLAQENSYLDVSFIFTQSERTSGFDSAKIANYAFGVIDFLDEKPKLIQNEKVRKYALIAKNIFSKSRLFKRGNPQCFLYYLTTGKWTEDQNLEARRQAATKDIESIGLFRSVDFECFGAASIQRLYRESKNAISREIVFSRRVVAPDTAGVEQAFIGILPATEFLKLIHTDTGEMISSLFYDNVRHWQDWNAVNIEIAETLRDEGKRKLFPLLNNGVTIVARRVTPTGDKFVIDDYQIVNGCQTSYVIHECHGIVDEKIYVPVRLIATSDEEIRNSIIKATNRQTQVSDEQLFSLSEFPKKLEAFFPTFTPDKKLYYERRSRQYGGSTEIEKVRVITTVVVVRAFASVFRELPHRATRNYKALVREVGKEIFGSDHRLEPYYTAAFAHYRLEFLFRNQHLRAELKPARYHILLAARLLFNKAPLPRMNSHEMARYCEEFNSLLWDDSNSRTLMLKAATLVEKVAAGNFHRDNIRTESFTESVKLRARSTSSKAL